MLHLELQRQLNDAQKFSAKDDTVASFADWKQSTVQNVISSQKRKIEDDEANHRTFLVKKPRLEIHKEILSNSGDNETFEISDEVTLESNGITFSSFDNITGKHECILSFQLDSISNL